MFDQGGGQGAPESLRGWLSEVYFPSLVEGSTAALVNRLGGKATVDDPLFGQAVGLDAIQKLLAESATWAAEVNARYTRGAVTTGTDRDVAEGVLHISASAAALDVPVAVVAERRKSREVCVRIYFPSDLEGKPRERAPLVPSSTELPLADLAKTCLEALGRADVASASACLTRDAVLTSPRGNVFTGAELGHALRRVAEGGFELTVGGTADDGRSVAVEATVTRARGQVVPPEPLLLVLTRSDDGPFSALRLYGDLVV